MSFISANYGLLLVTTFIVYWALPNRRARLALLLIASNIFYMSWNPRLVVLLWFSTGLDFVCGGRIAQSAADRTRLRWLHLSLLGNLGILGLFKYYGFFVDSAIVVLQEMGFHPHENTLHFILPLGISFYTFQSLSYTIDIYRRELQPSADILEFAVFISFFPQLVAGPIVRARDFLPQAQVDHRLDWTEVQWGLERVLLGLVKKAVIADNLAGIVNATFNNVGPETTSTNAWFAVIAFYGQAYCDFSGYSDIAIGSSRLFGYRLKENFLWPYRTKSPQELWNAWHVTLGTWLRDYVYIPLGGSRKGPRRTYWNLLAIWVISGLWHGAAWTFLLWGVWNGIVVCVHRYWNRSGRRMPGWAGLTGQIWFFCVGLYAFRANSTADLFVLLRAAVEIPTTLPNAREWIGLGWCLALFFGEPLGPQCRRLCRMPGWGAVFQGVLTALGILLLMAATPAASPDFIYFVF